MASKSLKDQLQQEKTNRTDPKNNIESVDDSSHGQSLINCFFKACDREASEKLLLEAYNYKHQNGLYMVRESKRDENKFILSMIKDGQCFHYRSHHNGNGTFLDEKTESIFYSLDELLDYYQGEGSRLLRCSLTTPIRGQPIPAFAQRRGPTTVLHQAAREGNRATIDTILQDPNCPNIHSKDEEGNTALHVACFNGRDDAVRALLKAGARWKFVNAFGWTSLHNAATGNWSTIIDLLVTRSQADVDTRNPFNMYSPMHCAAACNNVEALATLIAHDAPLRSLTDEGETPHDLAIKHKANDCVEKLASSRAKPALSRRNNFYHGSLTNEQMQAILNYYKNSDGYFFVRESLSNPNDYAISIIWQHDLVHVKLHKKNNNSFYYEDRLHYHDSIEHAVDYFLKLYKSVIKPLSPELAKIAYAHDSTPSSSQRSVPSGSKKPRSIGSASMELSNSDLGATNGTHPFNKARSQTVHNKHKILPAIGKRLVPALFQKGAVVIHEDQLTIGKLLGEGNFGKVYRGEYRDEHGQTFSVAVKALKADITSKSKEEMKQEAFVMKELSHPCIVRLFGVCQSKRSGNILMVQELLSMGSLLDYLKSHVRTSTRALFSLWITQILHGMAYMEKKRFVHRDLAARNILMQSHSRIKISDFGLSRSVDANDYYVQQSDTPIPIAWYAPESLAQSKFTSKSDVWSFGVTAWEIYTFGQYPYGSMSNDEVYPYIVSGGRLQRPASCSSSVFDIIRHCWSFEAHDRPSFPELLDIFANRSEYSHAINSFRSLSKYLR